jgi:hypothetical protein
LVTTSQSTKLVVLPEELVKDVRAIAIKRGVSLANFTAEVLEQAIRADRIGASLSDTVDAYNILNVTRTSGAVQIPRSNLNAMISELYKSDRDKLMEVWERTGRWYGEYLRTLLGSGALAFFERALEASWNLDEVEIEEDGLMIRMRFTSFVMSWELTELLISYITGFMKSLGYVSMEMDYRRGLANFLFRRTPNG